ncbi:hypothetical protein JNJ66_03025 [Candidatus Saccharibacteria bacterium]|nr:hypothetical protein [Candidatus Saccharibacteria bacterium]
MRSRSRSRQPIVRQSGKIANVIFSVTLLALAAGILFFRQDIQDWMVLRNYQPNADIRQLAERAALSAHGRHVFYVTQPELHGKQSFSEKCRDVANDASSNVLGCYVAHRTYIFDVKDERLQGVREVTAAHEMLHAAYERLQGSERERVDGLIQKQLDTAVDEHIKELIILYNRIEPGQLLNEMHSILATEQRTISPELEDYYKRYFEDRATVVGLSDDYRAVFDELKSRQEQLVRDIESLANRINDDTAELNLAVTRFNKDVQDFNAAAASGTMTQQEFAAERSALTARKDELARLRTANDGLRAEYEAKQAEFESLAIEYKGLQEKVDSSLDATGDLTEVE